MDVVVWAWQQYFGVMAMCMVIVVVVVLVTLWAIKSCSDNVNEIIDFINSDIPELPKEQQRRHHW